MQIFTKMVQNGSKTHVRKVRKVRREAVGKPSGRVGVVGREGADATGGEGVSCGGICVGVWER